MIIQRCTRLELDSPPTDYPERIVDHTAERVKALARYQAARS